ncbi:MAG TPA: hypothetical protein VF556_03230 [Pyrinomonadaceae bacterium]|jgi:hypothetical protein
MSSTSPIFDLKEIINSRLSALPDEFLNAYQISNTEELYWDVSIYKVERKDKSLQSHLDRGEVKRVMWDYYFANKMKCGGRYKFIIDIDPQTVVIPATWELSESFSFGNFNITLIETKTVDLSPKNQKIAIAILKEGLKTHFKFNRKQAVGHLGNLWQDFDKFCQEPIPDADGEFCISRRFETAVRVLSGDNWVVKCAINTTLTDALSFADYYNEGRVNELAEKIELKRTNKLNRQNQMVNVRVLRYNNNPNFLLMEALELEDPDIILRHGNLNSSEQMSLKNGSIRCNAFKRSAEEIPLSEMRLILDSQITGEDHAETIIAPAERESLMRGVRSFIDGADIFGQKIQLAELPFKTSWLNKEFVFPPAVRVRSGSNRTDIIPAPTIESEGKLKDRTKRRSDHIRRNGFLVQRPINPLLAFPHHAEEAAARRMTNDLNLILESQNVDFRFNYARYHNVEDIRREIVNNDYDAVFAVLPGSRINQDVYEKIKQQIDVPSQCIELKNTLPRKFINTPPRILEQKELRLARKIRQRYELCILNLLVKHHWLPFIPTSKFCHNVQVGLDVGGTHNTDAVSCIGYGFNDPEDVLIFRPERIPIEVQKAEPIPTRSLYNGLLTQFEIVKSELDAAGKPFDFEKAVFYRDGQLLGDGDAWNEREALMLLHQELQSRGWVSSNSVWTAVEVMKLADNWRIFRGERNKAVNPLAGRYLYPFDEANAALILTTGSQHLTQGTACPLRIRIIDIYGKSNAHKVIQDLIWQSDMCFTKPDVGMRLPWVLQVADAGALQQSRSYKITGVTV